VIEWERRRRRRIVASVPVMVGCDEQRCRSRGNDREYVRSSGHDDVVRHDSTQTDEEIILRLSNPRPLTTSQLHRVDPPVFYGQRLNEQVL